MATWTSLSTEDRNAIIAGVESGTDPDVLAQKYGIKSTSLKRKLRRIKHDQKIPTEDEPSQEQFKGVNAFEIFKYLKRSPRSLKDLSIRFDRSESTIRAVIRKMEAAGYGLHRDYRNIISHPLKPPAADFVLPALFPKGRTTEVAFAILGDTHGGSKFEQVTALQDFIHVAQEEYGVRHVLHCGDALAGTKVYRGQEFEVYEPTGMGQAEAVANNLPHHRDLKWYLIGGNHDYSFYKWSGLDALQYLHLKDRDDIILLPYDAANVPILPGVDAYLCHPAGAVPYALSYRGQKFAAQINQAELMKVVMGKKKMPTVRLMLIGHLHVMCWFRSGPMAVFQVGCFEGQTGYLKRKGLVPHIGGIIVKCRFVGSVLQQLEFIPRYYQEIEDDYKPHLVRRLARVEPVMELETLFSYEEEVDAAAKQ